MLPLSQHTLQIVTIHHIINHNYPLYCLIVTGVRFKLVKSNSCSSRLELVGTGKINSLQQHQQMHQQISQNMQRDDEKRRSILGRLQHSTTSTTSNPPLSSTTGSKSPTSTNKKAAIKKGPLTKSSDPETAEATAAKAAIEKCVKQIVERLETTRSAAAVTSARQTSGANPSNGPRIIDSKCIEKLSGEELSSSSANNGQQKPPKLIINNITATACAGVTDGGGCGLRADSPVVTVNNSISIPDNVAEEKTRDESEPSIKNNVKIRQESIYAAAKEILEQKQQLQQKTAAQQQTGKTKVVRNRNVDLALSIVKNQKNVAPSNVAAIKEERVVATNGGVQFKDAKESLKASSSSSSPADKQKQQQQRPLLTTFSQQHSLLKQQKDKRMDPKKVNSGKQEKVVTPAGGVGRQEEQQQKKNKKVEEQKQPEAVVTSSAANGVGEDSATKDGQRMIKWSSLNAKFDEKFYVSNDAKLKQKKIYDEMEFEEFQVYDTTVAQGGAAASQATTGGAVASECYDSLNSNK